MKIIINKGHVYLSDTDNDDIEIISDSEITGLDFNATKDWLGNARSYRMVEVTACANTGKMVEDLKGGA